MVANGQGERKSVTIHFHNITCMYCYALLLANHHHSSSDVSSITALGASYFGGHPNGDLFLPCFLAVGGVVAESTRGRDRTDADVGDGGVTTRLSS